MIDRINRLLQEAAEQDAPNYSTEIAGVCSVETCPHCHGTGYCWEQIGDLSEWPWKRCDLCLGLGTINLN